MGTVLNTYQPQISHVRFWFLLRFLPAIWVLLYSQTSFKVFETSECFLSYTNNNMHILATETEEQAVYFGHLIHPSYSILPPIHKKLTVTLSSKQFSFSTSLSNVFSVYVVINPTLLRTLLLGWCSNVEIPVGGALVQNTGTFSINLIQLMRSDGHGFKMEWVLLEWHLGNLTCIYRTQKDKTTHKKL